MRWRLGRSISTPSPAIDDGLPILTGVDTGTVNSRVDAQLRRYAEQWYAFQHRRAGANGVPRAPHGNEPGLP